MINIEETPKITIEFAGPIVTITDQTGTVEYTDSKGFEAYHIMISKRLQSVNLTTVEHYNLTGPGLVAKSVTRDNTTIKHWILPPVIKDSTFTESFLEKIDGDIVSRYFERIKDTSVYVGKIYYPPMIVISFSKSKSVELKGGFINPKEYDSSLNILKVQSIDEFNKLHVIKDVSNHYNNFKFCLSDTDVLDPIFEYKDIVKAIYTQTQNSDLFNYNSIDLFEKRVLYANGKISIKEVIRSFENISSHVTVEEIAAI